VLVSDQLCLDDDAGQQHREQRRIINPAFGSNHIRDMTVEFIAKSAEVSAEIASATRFLLTMFQMCEIWAARCAENGGTTQVDALDWVSGLCKMCLSGSDPSFVTAFTGHSRLYWKNRCVARSQSSLHAVPDIFVGFGYEFNSLKGVKDDLGSALDSLFRRDVTMRDHIRLRLNNTIPLLRRIAVSSYRFSRGLQLTFLSKAWSSPCSNGSQ
jgi:hypothetical protein